MQNENTEREMKEIDNMSLQTAGETTKLCMI